MDKVKVINWDNIPCWYELSFRTKNPAFILRVHRDFIARQEPIPGEAEIVKYLKNEFGFETFVGSLSGNFGFDGVLKRKGEKNDFAEFIIKLPKKTEQVCNSCGGSGKDDILERPCVYCDGKKIAYAVDWKRAYAISASLNIFFSLANFPDAETFAKDFQLITIGLTTEREIHGGSLWGRFSIPLVKWLCSFDENKVIPEISTAMLVAYRHIAGLSSYERQEFRTRVDKGFFVTSCPGDACGINPCSSVSYEIERNRGYEFSCHNVDSPLQQITLLAGLAALCDEYKNWLCRKIAG